MLSVLAEVMGTCQ